MRLRKRLPADLPQVLRLLEAAGLPPDGLDLTEGWVFEHKDRVIGHVATESTPDTRVLRSLVVDPAHRGQGLGEALMEAAEGDAKDMRLVLKTDTVGPWMEARGYRRITLAKLPTSVQTTTQFSGSLCAGTPVYLKETPMNQDTLKAAVRERYAGFVTRNTSCCGPSKSCGCGSSLEDPSLKIGYALQDVEAVPQGANLGLGCGNPVALASLQAGEVVLDLGSGAGFDAFLASPRVGPEGRVIGVDMTPEMIDRSRSLAERNGFTNVEFRQGDIEALPVDSDSVDAIISNCVINLTTDKAKAFREAFRVLKPGGRLMVSDLVLRNPLPESILRDLDAYAACIAGALQKADYLAAIEAAGFQGITTVGESHYEMEVLDLAELQDAQARNPTLTVEDLKAAAGAVVSVQIQATKTSEPSTRSCCGPACCAKD